MYCRKCGLSQLSLAAMKTYPRSAAGRQRSWPRQNRGARSRNAASGIADRQDRYGEKRTRAWRRWSQRKFWIRSRNQAIDTITRLTAEYFKADTVLLGFADESRVWIKSYWGESVRELPRKGSMFEMVLAADGPGRGAGRFEASLFCRAAD